MFISFNNVSKGHVTNYVLINFKVDRYCNSKVCIMLHFIFCPRDIPIGTEVRIFKMLSLGFKRQVLFSIALNKSSTLSGE